MNRRQKRGEKPETNISMIILAGIVVVVAIAFTITYISYSNRISKNTKIQTLNTQIISSTENEMLNMITNEEEQKSVSSPVGKSVNEMENTEKIAINTSDYENREEEKKTEQKQQENKQEVRQEETQQEEIKDPNFIKPAEGEIIKNYSKDNLVYSNTLDEWTTHLGIDIAMQKTDVVKSVADGKVKSIKNDPRYGLTVVIEHANGFESIYSSLLTAEFIKVGEEIKQGSTIATIGNTATFEIADTTHLHFEMKKDGQSVDPNIYIK